MAKLEIDDFYNLEFSRIPSLWQFKKEKIKWVSRIAIALGIVDFILFIIIPHTRKIVDTGFYLGSLGTFKYASYNLGLTIAIIAVSALMFLLLLWAGISYSLEKRAYRTASKKFAEYDFEYKRKVMQEHKAMQHDLGIFD